MKKPLSSFLYMFQILRCCLEHVFIELLNEFLRILRPLPSKSPRPTSSIRPQALYRHAMY